MSAPVRFGISTPGLTLVGPPATASAWERDASVGEIAAIAAAADRVGCEFLTCSEHVGIPSEVEQVRGGRYYDPLSTLGYLAATTTRIRLVTYVLVLAYSHPLELAKRYGTLDRLSGGRVILGMGVGSLKPEFDLLGLGGAEFEQRGARGDDALRAIRAAFARRMPEYHGPFYDFADFIIDPCGVQEHVPLWIGGRTLRSLRRAVELGDGWMPFGLSAPEMAAMIGAAAQTPAWDARHRPFELVLGHDGWIDPAGHPGEAARVIADTLARGATIVIANLAARSAAHYVEQLEAMAALRI